MELWELNDLGFCTHVVDTQQQSAARSQGHTDARVNKRPSQATWLQSQGSSLRPPPGLTQRKGTSEEEQGHHTGWTQTRERSSTHGMLSPSHLLDFSSLPLRVFPLIEKSHRNISKKKKQVKSFKIFQVITAQKKKRREWHWPWSDCHIFNKNANQESGNSSLNMPDLKTIHVTTMIKISQQAIQLSPWFRKQLY